MTEDNRLAVLVVRGREGHKADEEIYERARVLSQRLAAARQQLIVLQNHAPPVITLADLHPQLERVLETLTLDP